MRLLNVHTWEMKTFASKRNRPPYAILSHTWTDNEVSFQDWEKGVAKGLDASLIPHSEKVRRFGEMVKTHSGEWGEGFTWVWVDTCCIDQKSSAELSEAINSMYAWYQEAARCYAYLEDVALSPHPRLVCEGIAEDLEQATQGASDDNSFAKKFTASRWFTRGWTLQELVAPLDLVFINQEWSVIGAKGQEPLTGLISSCTGIPDQLVAHGGWNPRGVSIADRMSWAANRETTRPEDVAYCLLGLFKVNMPLLYGEGEVRAFHRLQEEIMKSDYDQTMFAWGDLVEEFARNPQHLGRKRNKGRFVLMPPPPKWLTPSECPRPVPCGLFADSPRDFNTSLKIDVESSGFHHEMARRAPPAVVNGGVLLDLVRFAFAFCIRFEDESRFAWEDQFEMVLLMCVSTDKRTSRRRQLAIALHFENNGYHTRTRELCFVDEVFDRHNLVHRPKSRHVRPLPRDPFACRQDWFIRFRASDLEPFGVWSSNTDCKQDCHLRWRDKILHFAEHNAEQMTFGFIYELHEYPEEGVDNVISIVLRRTQREHQEGVELHVGITPPFSLLPRFDRRYDGPLDYYPLAHSKVPEVTQWHLMPRKWELCRIGPVAGFILLIGAEYHGTRWVVDFYLAREDSVSDAVEPAV